MLISKKSYGSWREIQEEYSEYKASLGPWSEQETIDFLVHEYKLDKSFVTNQVKAFFESNLIVFEFQI